MTRSPSQRPARVILRLAAAAALLTLAACDPIWRVSLSVRDPAGHPVAGASVILVCTERTWESTLVQTATDGTASLGGMGTSLPPGCALGVAHPRYATRRTTFESMCGAQPLDDCRRVREERLVLEPLAAAPPAAAPAR
ncbi:MAG TPA: carboxypeptidase-like regulatory domain-containing protein [Kofleriaceae bacterium]|nr:carboxypeptidase-like regulatory domain-containing protein [Kofleriaceae bacterium]